MNENNKNISKDRHESISISESESEYKYLHRLSDMRLKIWIPDDYGE